MQKYKVTQKLKKTRHCSYYNAENLITGEQVTIKKLSLNNNWDEMLKKKQITMMKQPHYPFLARIKEIIKQNGKFFIVHEELTQCVDDLKKKALSLAEVTNIGRQMIEIVIHLLREGVMLYELRPEFFFVNKKRVKLAYIVSREEQNDMLEHMDYRYFAPEMTLGTNGQFTEESNVFALGQILCELMLGKPLIPAKSKIDYMYMVCGLFPKQKLEGGGSSVNTSQSSLQPTRTFEALMEPVCSSQEFIDLLGEMTCVNCKFRIKLEEALKRMKNLQFKFQAEDKERSISKRRLINSMQASSVIEKMNKKVEEVSRERQRYRTSPNNRVSPDNPNGSLLSTTGPKLISTNHKINIDLGNDLYERIGFMPQIPRECMPLRTQKNVQDNASFSLVTKQKNLSDLIIPVNNNKVKKSNLPSIVHPVKERSTHREVYYGIRSTTFTQRKMPSTRNRIKTSSTGLMQIKPNTTMTTQKPQKTRASQLTNYALNNSGHLGVQVAPDEAEIGNEFDFRS